MDTIAPDTASRLIVALDFPSAAAALDFVDRMDGRLRWVKVGLELYLAAGAGVVDALRSRGLEVFLDLKLHDIPNTVAGAVRSLAGCGACLLTVHTLGGPAMLEAAQKAAGQMKLLGVTVLTSMDAPQLRAIGVQETAAETVLRLAKLAAAAGLAGMVCSPEEVRMLRETLGAAPLLVVPGIRPVGAAVGDQSRTATPKKAMADGASLLVIGRPITQAVEPGDAFDRILASLD